MLKKQQQRIENDSHELKWRTDCTRFKNTIQENITVLGFVNNDILVLYVVIIALLNIYKLHFYNSSEEKAPFTLSRAPDEKLLQSWGRTFMERKCSLNPE